MAPTAIVLERVLLAKEGPRAKQVALTDTVSIARKKRVPPFGAIEVSYPASSITARRYVGPKTRPARREFLKEVRSHLLLGEVRTNAEPKIDSGNNVFDGGDLLRHAPVGNQKPVLIHRALLSDLISLLHAM